MMTDVMFRCGSRRLARLAREQGDATVYLYSFEVGLSMHADELGYVFGPDHCAVGLTLPLVGVLASDDPVTAIQHYWLNFAYRGNPNGAGLPTWPKYDPDTDRHMTLVDPPTPGSHLQNEACNFWDAYLSAR